MNGMRICTEDNFEGIVTGHGWRNRKQTLSYKTLDEPSISRLCFRHQVIEFRSEDDGEWIPYRKIREKQLSIIENR